MNANEIAIVVTARDEATKVFKQTERAGNDLGKSLTDIGKIAAGVSLAGMLSGAPAAMGGFIDLVDQSTVSTGKLQAQLGLTKTEAAELGNIAKHVYRNNFGESLDQVNDQVARVSQSLGLQGDELKETVIDINRVSDAFGDQGAETKILVESLRTMKSAFPGMTEKQSMDLITKGFQNGLGASGDFLDTLQEYPASFSAIGLSANDMMAFLNVGMKAGARNTDVLADAVKEFGIRVKTAGDTGQKALAEMFPPAEAARLQKAFADGGEAGRSAFYEVMQQLSATKDEQERYTLAVQLFGTKGEDLVGVLDKMGPGLAEIAKGTEDATGATAALDSQYAGTASTLETLKRQTMGYVSDALAPISPIIGTVVPQFADLAGGALDAGGSFAIMAAQAKPAFTAVASGISAAGLAAKAAAPELIALTVVMAVVTAGYLKQKNDAAQLTATVAGLSDKHAALAEVEDKLTEIHGNSAKGLERLRDELTKQIGAEDAASAASKKAAVQTEVTTLATEQAARASGDFGQRVKDLDSALEEISATAASAFGVLDKYKNVPTLEQLELASAIATVNAQLAAAEQALHSAEAAGDTNTAGIEEQIKALETEKQRLDDSNSVLEANRAAADAAGRAKVGASLSADKLTQSERDLLDAAAAASEKLAGQATSAADAAYSARDYAAAVDTARGALEALNATPTNAFPLISPGQYSAPAFATGTEFAPGGMAWVGEHGPELINLPRGSQVFTASESRSMVAADGASGGSSAGGGVTNNYYGPYQNVLPNVRNQDDLNREARFGVQWAL